MHTRPTIAWFLFSTSVSAIILEACILHWNMPQPARIYPLTHHVLPYVQAALTFLPLFEMISFHGPIPSHSQTFGHPLKILHGCHLPGKLLWTLLSAPVTACCVSLLLPSSSWNHLLIWPYCPLNWVICRQGQRFLFLLLFFNLVKFMFEFLASTLSLIKKKIVESFYWSRNRTGWLKTQHWYHGKNSRCSGFMLFFFY